MPLRSSSMELSDPVTPDTSVDLNGTANRRKSGRARQKPVLLNKDPNIPQNTTSSGKRKRAETRAEDVQDLSEDENKSSHGESEPDEEELKERRRKATRSKKNTAKPAAKKARTGPNLNTSLAVRPAVNGLKRAQKQPRARMLKDVEDAGTGLYGEPRLLIENRMLNDHSRNFLPWTYRRSCRSRLDYALGTEQCCSYARSRQPSPQMYWMQD